MSVTEQLLPTISALVALGEFATDAPTTDAAAIKTVSERLTPQTKQRRAQGEWQGAIRAIEQLLSQRLLPNAPKSTKKRRSSQQSSPQALLLSGPVPVLSSLALSNQVSSWTFVPQSSELIASSVSALSPVERFFKKTLDQPLPHRLLPLLEDDPLILEQFVVLFTAEFALVLVLGKDADDEMCFQFSFTPQVVDSVWRMLRSRIRLIRPQQLDFIDPLVEKFAPKEPHYRTVSQFNRWLLAYLPQDNRQEPPPLSPPNGAKFGAKSESTTNHTACTNPLSQQQPGEPGQGLAANNDSFSDSELLKAMAHEIRTPLTTIRTYTRSLLKRKDLDPQVIKRLQSIDRECTQQIDRFSLIFRAVELEAASQSPKSPPKSPLSAIALQQVFREAIPQWQQAARRRNLSLEVALPPDLPMVASDPTMLQHVLTGLVELFTHSVSPGSHIQLQVLHAGDQLKLQFQSHGNPQRTGHAFSCAPPPLQSLGHLLMFQPETGGLSLNLEATKNLFHALGAKLTVRERPNQGTTWTVFLPLESSGLTSYPIV